MSQFVCEVHLVEEQIGAPVSEPTYLVKYQVRQGDIIQAEGALAVLDTPLGARELRTKFRVLVDFLPLEPGEEVYPGMPIIQVIAEGEDIPPDFRYCTLHSLA